MMALCWRGPAPGLIYHSDQGSQYTDDTYKAIFQAYGIRASMNIVGTWYVDAPTESFIGRLTEGLAEAAAGYLLWLFGPEERSQCLPAVRAIRLDCQVGQQGPNLGGPKPGDRFPVQRGLESA